MESEQLQLVVVLVADTVDINAISEFIQILSLNLANLAFNLCF
jgi:hypothetical protein